MIEPHYAHDEKVRIFFLDLNENITGACIVYIIVSVNEISVDFPAACHDAYIIAHQIRLIRVIVFTYYINPADTDSSPVSETYRIVRNKRVYSVHTYTRTPFCGHRAPAFHKIVVYF